MGRVPPAGGMPQVEGTRVISDMVKVAGGDLRLAGFALGKVGLQPEVAPSFEDWCAVGRFIRDAARQA